ncbi:hypothetical protein HRI96_08865 [Treponema parvum]|uniref:Uncharacterized protein n=1 Tax=Treponema parvum TaxID=138851 RepID=A0A975IDL3_9SPIR|nr:hypothetical protein [Treponema parvum]QTQ12299.1 hypothetical protein HRI96_08865 [Treponema parvum]QTQ15716.1 hypothetical protein HXT04_02800 [Treponema parvum]
MFYDVIDKKLNEKCHVKFYNMAPLIMEEIMTPMEKKLSRPYGDTLFARMVKYMAADKAAKDLFN